MILKHGISKGKVTVNLNDNYSESMNRIPHFLSLQTGSNAHGSGHADEQRVIRVAALNRVHRVTLDPLRQLLVHLVM